MTWLITSDLHLSDRPRDAYRFGLFKWLRKKQDKYRVSATFILGDLTDKKDNHSSQLVNKIIDSLLELTPPVYILKGNHDYTDPDNPFFKFLSWIEGVEFITEPREVETKAFMIPHQVSQAALDEACAQVEGYTTHVFAHQCLTGAISETGAQLTGLKWPLKGIHTYAGDIHRPQTLDCGVTYVGAPYHIRFGDDYTPRVLLLDKGKERNLYFDCPHKWSLNVKSAADIEDNSDLREGDHVKITVELPREEVVKWASHKQAILDACKALNLEVFGVNLVMADTQPGQIRPYVKAKSNEEIYHAFCLAEKVPEAISNTGTRFLEPVRSSRVP